MAKLQTRMEKFKNYREEIKSDSFNENVEIIQEKVEKPKLKKKILVNEPQVVNKHVMEEKKVKEKAPKTIYDEYLIKRRIKFFLYSTFVLLFIGTLITILVLLTNNYF